MIDFLIVGHGLAGSVLSHLLRRDGKRVLVLDNAFSHSASKVAAGLINPLIGPKFNTPLELEQCLLANAAFFGAWEDELGEPLLKKFLLHRIFVSARQKDRWNEKMKTSCFLRYAHSIETVKFYEQNSILAPWGGGIQLAQRLDFTSLLKASEEKLKDDDSWAEGKFIESDWSEAKKIIFCEGYRVIRNPWFGGLPFAPAPGEILLLKKEAPLAASNGTWIIPEKEKGSLAGSTWKHDDLESGNTDRAKEAILANLSQFTPKFDEEITGQRSGVRSGTRDRTPIIGKHTKNPRMHLFNGFGSRGATTIVHHAKLMRDFVLLNRPLPRQVNLERFEKK